MAFAELSPLTAIPFLISFFVGQAIGPILGSTLIEGSVSVQDRAISSTLLAVVGNLGMIIASGLAFLWFKDHRQLFLVLDAISTTMFLGYTSICFRKRNFQKKRPIEAGATFSFAFEKRNLAPIASCLLLLIVLYSQSYFFPIMFKELGVDEYKFTTTMGLVGGICIVGLGLLLANKIILNTYSGRLKAACLGSAAAFVVIPFCRNPWELSAGTAILSIGEVPIYPVLSHVVYAVYPRDQVGAAAALKGMLTALAQVITPLITLAMIGLPLGIQGLLFVVSMLFVYRSLLEFYKNRTNETPA
jgi:hypothetical protein